MPSLAMAMLLTGAVDDAQHRRGPPPPAPIFVAPAPRPQPEGRAQPARRERPPASYFTSADWPVTDHPGEGTVSFRLSIDPNGRVSDCAITVTSGHSSLDQQTCRILRSRARYTPARDAAGNPTTGSDLGRVTWRVFWGDETPAAQQSAPNP